MIEYIKTVQYKRLDFDVYFNALPENCHPADLFDDDLDSIEELCQKIDDGVLEWFIAHVEIRHKSLVLSDSYIGGCLYDSIDDFIEEKDGIFDEMVEECLPEAYITLENIVLDINKIIELDNQS